MKGELGTREEITGNHYLIKTANPSKSGSGGGSGGNIGNSNPEGSTGTPPPAESSGSSSSKGWIAGAVICPLAGVALIGLALWYFRRRRASQSSPKPLEVSAEGAPSDYAAKNVTQSQTFHELGGTKPPMDDTPIHQELPANNEPIHELPANAK